MSVGSCDTKNSVQYAALVLKHFLYHPVLVPIKSVWWNYEITPWWNLNTQLPRAPCFRSIWMQKIKDRMTGRPRAVYYMLYAFVMFKMVLILLDFWFCNNSYIWIILTLDYPMSNLRLCKRFGYTKYLLVLSCLRLILYQGPTINKKCKHTHTHLLIKQSSLY